MLKNCKLICTVVGLVAVLVMGLALPKASYMSGFLVKAQDNPFDPCFGTGPICRDTVLQAISSAVGSTLTASADDPLDLQRTLFWSSSKKTMAYVPLMPIAKGWDLAEELIAGNDVGPVNFGAIYIADHPELPSGIYQLKLLSRSEAGLFKPDGDLLTKLKVTLEAAPGRPPFEIGVRVIDNVAHNSEIIQIHLKSCTTITIYT